MAEVCPTHLGTVQHLGLRAVCGPRVVVLDLHVCTNPARGSSFFLVREKELSLGVVACTSPCLVSLTKFCTSVHVTEEWMDNSIIAGISGASVVCAKQQGSFCCANW